MPYVGSDVESSALCLDKLAFKRLLHGAGIPQVDFCEAGEEGGESGPLPSAYPFG